MTSPASRTARVYDRISRVYDLMEAPMDWLGGRTRRERVVGGARGRTLEVGVGTGRNLDLYPDGMDLTAIDLSEGMLSRARERAVSMGMDVTLQRADVEDLPYPDDSFDTVTATCVFCSVDDPVRGLEEVRRVVRPDGEVRLFEHVRPRNPLFGRLFDLLTPLTRRMMGPAINRRTVENVRAAGLEIADLRAEGIWREIVARPAPGDAARG